MNLKYLAIGSLIFSLGGAWLFSVAYDVNFSLVVFIVLQCLVIILATMIWPALNSR
jgi:hypothetical protein|tara:strand:- start:636 stop:803 length:168 start_codon:yes stop_codon:yes gene_type:complete